ncbi:MAG: polysaccharide deacetylase family protein [Candidatus Omnitrophica bacterium]|nr:polysaccharide deacetylase family protein [Candidatus Omnitrophota bacterium]
MKKNKIAVLNYHEVQSSKQYIAASPEERSYALRSDVFENQMAALTLMGFRCGTLSDLQKKDAGGRMFLLTFDDGCLSHYEHVRPILEDRGFRGVFFVSAGLIGSGRCMTASQLRGMVKAGFEIGSHGYDHVPLTTLSDQDLRREIFDSRRKLEDVTGAPVRSFSIPRGFYHPRVRHCVVSSGYGFLFTSHFGLHELGGDPYYIRRMAVKSTTSSPDFESWVHGRAYARQFMEELKELARRGLGFKTYQDWAHLKAQLRMRFTAAPQ